MQPQVMLCAVLVGEPMIRSSCATEFSSDCSVTVWCSKGKPLYNVMMLAPPTLAIVPNTLASPCLLNMFTCSSLQNIIQCENLSATKKGLNVF